MPETFENWVGRRQISMASEIQPFLPVAADGTRQHSNNRLQRLFVTTLTVAIAMITLLIGIGIGAATGLETEVAPAVELNE